MTRIILSQTRPSRRKTTENNERPLSQVAPCWDPCWPLARIDKRVFKRCRLVSSEITLQLCAPMACSNDNVPISEVSWPECLGLQFKAEVGLRRLQDVSNQPTHFNSKSKLRSWESALCEQLWAPDLGTIYICMLPSIRYYHTPNCL